MTTCLIDQEQTERPASTVPITKREALKLIDQLRAALGTAQKEWNHWQRAYMNLAPRFEQSCTELERMTRDRDGCERGSLQRFDEIELLGRERDELRAEIERLRGEIKQRTNQ